MWRLCLNNLPKVLWLLSRGCIWQTHIVLTERNLTTVGTLCHTNYRNYQTKQSCRNHLLLLASSFSFDVRLLEVAAVWIALVDFSSIWWFTEVFPVIFISMNCCTWRAERRRSTRRLVHVFRVAVDWCHCVVHGAHWDHIYHTFHSKLLRHLRHSSIQTFSLDEQSNHFMQESHYTGMLFFRQSNQTRT